MYAKVIIEIGVKNVDKMFTYVVPDNMKKDIKVGCRVKVKFGSMLLEGFVLELTNIDNVLRTKDLIGMWSTITINDNYPFTKKEKDLINNINKLLKEDLNDIFVLYKTGLY